MGSRLQMYTAIVLTLVTGTQPVLAASDHFTIKSKNVYEAVSVANNDVEPFIFVESAPGASTVHRAKKGDSFFAEVFLVDPSGAAALAASPLSNSTDLFPKGKDLGMTLGDWRQGQGAIDLKCKFNGPEVKTTIKSKFKKLASKGVYDLYGVRGTNLTKNTFTGGTLLGSDRASRSGSLSMKTVLDFCPSGFGTHDSLKLLMFYNAMPEQGSLIPGVTGAYQLFRILK